MVERFKRPGEPGPAHFAYGEASGEPSPAALVATDFLSSRNLYRRQPLRAVGEPRRQHSKTQWFIGSNAAFVVWVNTASITTGRTEADIAADGLDGLVFNLVEAGTYKVDCALGVAAFAAGALYMFDSKLPYTTIATDDRSLTIFVPRKRVLKRLGRFPTQILLRDLQGAPLADFISAQMQVLGDRVNRIAAADLEVALEHAVDLALSLAEAELRKPKGEADLLFEAASALVEQRYHDATLTPDAVAKSLKCSRATLYRAFAARGLTIAGLIKSTRMRHVIHALRLPDARTIADIALACGFGSDPSTFAKQFKRIYGMTPVDARAALSRGEKLRAAERG